MFSRLRRLFGIKPPYVNRIGAGAYPQAHRIFMDLVSTGKVPGLSVTVYRNGQVCFQNGYGYADLNSVTKIDPEISKLRAASASKPIAAMALAKMVEQGLLDLGDSFYKYVPEFPDKSFDITLEQLASHTSGIRGYRGKEYALNMPYSIAEGLSIFKDDPLEFRPGHGFLYNSFNWVMLARAMEVASGMSFSDYVKEHILDPLKMTQTVPENPDSISDRQAIFYTKWTTGFRKAVQVDNRYKLAGGGYLTTSADLARFGQACLNTEIVDKKVQEEFLRPRSIGGRSTYYGLGFEVSQDPSGRPYYGHHGNNVGGYSNFLVYPEHKTVIALLINCTDPKIQDELYGIYSYFLEEFDIT